MKFGGGGSSVGGDCFWWKGIGKFAATGRDSPPPPPSPHREYLAGKLSLEKNGNHTLKIASLTVVLTAHSKKFSRQIREKYVKSPSFEGEKNPPIKIFDSLHKGGIYLPPHRTI